MCDRDSRTEQEVHDREGQRPTESSGERQRHSTHERPDSLYALYEESHRGVSTLNGGVRLAPGRDRGKVSTGAGKGDRSCWWQG